MHAKRILVPVTLSDGSLSSVILGARLAQELSATIVLFHVLPLGVPFRHGEVLQRLHQLAAQASLPASVEYLIGEGSPAEEIIWQAKLLPADAIVMSTHACPRCLAWLHRQTAREVLRRLTCPIWLVAPRRHGEAVVVTIHEKAEGVLPKSVKHSIFSPTFSIYRPIPPVF
ncbi:MAG TPA: universal stress protein [Opitutales bacterium]|nr:universal stress protein [Opitutales bacterium]